MLCLQENIVFSLTCVRVNVHAPLSYFWDDVLFPCQQALLLVEVYVGRSGNESRDFLGCLRNLQRSEHRQVGPGWNWLSGGSFRRQLLPGFEDYWRW